MSNKPIFVATHPRACSTAFERVFMTRRDTIQCVHEPFGDAYYFGPERLAKRFENDAKAREESGFSDSTFKTIMDNINRENCQGKRVLIKDMAQYFVPPTQNPVSIAPSLAFPRRGIGTENTPQGPPKSTRRGSLKTQAEVYGGVDPPPGAPYATYREPGNPTVVPSDLLEQFHFAFLIRHPKAGIPSYYRCCIPPLEEMTGFSGFRNDEAGYLELRQLFDYLKGHGVIGPALAEPPSKANGATNGDSNGHTNGLVNGVNGATNGAVSGATNGMTNGERKHSGVQICVIDADDLLDKPAAVIETFCNSVGIDYHPEMLNWNSQEEENFAAEAFEKWKGFHEDAIHSRDLKPRKHKRIKSIDEDYGDWIEKYGEDGAKVIRKAVDENIEHYEYLKQFAIKV